MDRIAVRQRTGRTPRVAAAVVALVCAAGGAARAQSASAAALNREGYRLLKDGKIAEACEAFEASIRAQPGAGAYIALGECRELNHQLASAWSAYEAARDRARDRAKRVFASDRIAALEPRLSRMIVSVSETNRAAGVTITRNGILLDPRLWNVLLPIDGGDYVFEARAPGREPQRITVNVPVERGNVTAAVPDLERPVLPPPPPWTPRRKLAVGSFAVSVVTAAVGVVLKLQANADRELSEQLCGTDIVPTCEMGVRATQLSYSASDFDAGAYVTLGIAGVAAIAGTYLWFTGGREASHGVAIAPAVSPDRFAITAAWSF